MNPRKIVPDWFDIPSRVEFGEMILIPVTANRWVEDHDAVVSTRDYLHGGGMNPGMLVQNDVTRSPEFGWKDACWLDRHWKQRTAVCYGLMNREENRELGCLYIFPSYKQGFDADVFVWVRDEERIQGLDERLYRFAEEWVPNVWPLRKISWPGRNIPWVDWYALPEKNPQPNIGHVFVTCPRALVPNTFKVPERVETGVFVLAPLTLSMEASTLDHKARKLNNKHIKEFFLPKSEWSVGMTLQDTIIEISAIDIDWYVLSEFVYSIRTPDELNQIGRLYIQPTRKVGYDAEVHFWIGISDNQEGIEDDINRFVHQWIGDVWPFHKVAWPGRDISWDEWHNLQDYDPDPF